MLHNPPCSYYNIHLLSPKASKPRSSMNYRISLSRATPDNTNTERLSLSLSFSRFSICRLFPCLPLSPLPLTTPPTPAITFFWFPYKLSDELSETHSLAIIASAQLREKLGYLKQQTDDRRYRENGLQSPPLKNHLWRRERTEKKAVALVVGEKNTAASKNAIRDVPEAPESRRNRKEESARLWRMDESSNNTKSRGSARTREKREKPWWGGQTGSRETGQSHFFLFYFLLFYF